MADQKQVTSQADADPSDSPATTGTGAAALTRDRLQHLAGLVANGETTFAYAAREFSPEASGQLEARVRELRRARLVRFVALQIAWDIRGEGERQPREREHRVDSDRRLPSEKKND